VGSVRGYLTHAISIQLTYSLLLSSSGLTGSKEAYMKYLFMFILIIINVVLSEWHPVWNIQSETNSFLWKANTTVLVNSSGFQNMC